MKDSSLMVSDRGRAYITLGMEERGTETGSIICNMDRENTKI